MTPLSPQFVLAISAASAVTSVVFGLRAANLARISKQRAEAWPSFVDAFVSALSSGLSRTEAIEVAMERAPKVLVPALARFVQALTNERLQQALLHLKEPFSLAAVDEFVELLLTNDRLGGAGLVAVLRNHANRVRRTNAANSVAAAKTSATLAVAKLGVASPWVLLVLLLGRIESSESFSTTEGVGVLFVGLFTCLGAYRLISLLGRLEPEVRVYG